jgi:hypothetical protein
MLTAKFKLKKKTGCSKNNIQQFAYKQPLAFILNFSFLIDADNPPQYLGAHRHVWKAFFHFGKS